MEIRAEIALGDCQENVKQADQKVGTLPEIYLKNLSCS
jgi:hypothetical protein